MTKIEQVYHKICNDDNIKRIIKQQVFETSLRDDFYQEIILKLLEFKDTDLLIKFYDDDILERFIIKMCRYSLAKTKIDENGIRNGGGDFYIKYLLEDKVDIEDYEVVDNIDIVRDLDNKDMIDKIDTIMSKRNLRDIDKHYHNVLFSMYKNGMTIPQISKQMNISYYSVRYSIQKTIKMIKDRL